MIKKTYRTKHTNQYSKKEIIRNRIIAASILAIFFISILKLISPLFKNNNISLTSSPNEDALHTNDEVSTETTVAPKDTDIIPNNNITYGGEKFAIAADDVERIVKGQNIDDKKYIFLTFDDGPSPNTEKILDILKEKDVKATFFVLGSTLETNDKSKEILKRCITEGNAIANHTYSHNPKKLYPHQRVDYNLYLNEFNKTNDLLKGILGSDFDSRVTRMPEGRCSRVYYKDSNLPAFEEMLKNNNIIDIDWNSLNSDADGKNYSVEGLLENSKRDSKGLNQIVFLMHDAAAKSKTVEMLPALIDYFKSNGYEFKTIKSAASNTNNQ